MPPPLRKIVRVMTMKYRAGNRYESACSTDGMLLSGKTKPDSMNVGRKLISAASWLAVSIEDARAEMISPSPSVQIT